MTAEATIITVSNDPQRPAMFNIFADAEAAANSGDTIFLYGSSINYAGGLVTKQLYIYGNGAATINGAPGTTFGTSSTLTFNNGSSGSVVEGLKWVNGNFDQIAMNTDNITVRNCQLSRIRIGINADSCLIYNNLFYNAGTSAGPIRNVHVLGTQVNTQFHNNVFVLNNSGAGGILFFQSLSDMVVMNNAFITWTISESNMLIEPGAENNIFGNNIFYNLKNVSSNCNYCGFGNNLVFGCTICDLVTGTQSGNDNLFADPLFENYAGTGFDINSDDLALQAGSPGHLAGSDGTDIGIYGGQYPFNPVLLYNQLLPFQPYITNMLLINPVVPVVTGGPIEIEAGAIIFTE